MESATILLHKKASELDLNNPVHWLIAEHYMYNILGSQQEGFMKRLLAAAKPSENPVWC